MNDGDEAVLERWITHRDAEAFRTIVTRYSAMVYGTCLRILGNPTEAEDATQECFEALAQAKRSPGSYLGPWLHRVATGLSINLIRSEKRRKRREARFASEPKSNAEVEWNDIYEYVDEAITELPEKLRVPVVAHFLEDLSYEAIAQATGISPRTVSYRVGKGIELIGRSLRKRGITVATSALAAVMAAQLAEAAQVPASLAAILGKLALAHSANATAAISASTTAGKVLGGMLTVKQAIVAVVAITAVIGGLWVAQRAAHRASIESPAQLAPAQESLTAAVDPVADEPTPLQAPPTAGRHESPRESVSGVVKHINTGEPAAGVVVEAWSAETEAKEFETVTDEEGKYMLAGLTPGIRYGLAVENEEESYIAVETPTIKLRAGEARAGVDITLRAACSISGTVTDKSVTYHPSRLATVNPNRYTTKREIEKKLSLAVYRALVDIADKPLSGVKIVLAEELREGPGRRLGETVSDEKGRYAFPIVLPGTYIVLAEPPEDAVRLNDRHRNRFRVVELNAGERREDVNFSFRFGGVSVTGRVTNGQGKPVEGAEVVAEPWPVARPWSDGPVVHREAGSVKTVSDGNGHYRLDGLFPPDMREANYYLLSGMVPKETFVIRARAGGYAPSQMIVPAMPENLVRDIRLANEKLNSLLDRMGVDDKLEAIAGDVALPASRGNVITGVDLVIEREALVSGRVVDTWGRAVPNCWVTLGPLEDHPKEALAAIPRTDHLRTWCEGVNQFTIARVPEGTYRFGVWTHELGNVIARNAPISVRWGDSLSDVEVTVWSVEDRAVLTGRVADASSRRPVKGFIAKVSRLKRDDGIGGLCGNRRRDGPEAGEFLIEGIEPGIATLNISAPGYVPEEAQVRLLRAQTANIDFFLEPEGVLQGYVTLNGEGKGACWVRAYEKRDASFSVQTDEEGYYEFEKLKEGDYLVRSAVNTGGGPPATRRYESSWAEVESGKVTRVDFELEGSAAIRGAFSSPDEHLSWHVSVFDGSATGRVPSEGSLSYHEQLRAGAWNLQEYGH